MGSLAARLVRTGPAEPERVRGMLEAAPHRGSRHDLASHGAVTLGVSCRDDRDDASISAGNGYLAAFCGRLDNAAELARDLKAQGQEPGGETAADVLEAAFRAWGERAPARLRGQFSAAVTDGDRLWGFRDQVGFRAVFYRDDGDGFQLASEAKQVVAGAGIPREPDLEAVERIFYGKGGGPDAPAAVKGANRMAAATVMRADRSGRRESIRYWEPERLVETARLTPHEADERFAELFAQAVARCMTGDDAISLSGGIDSPAVAAFAAPGHMERFGKPVAALSAVFPDLPSVDERSWIEMVTGYLDMPLHTYRPQAKGLDDVQRWSALLDSPTPIVSVPELDENYALARSLGHRALLTGELAEYVIDNSGHLAGHLLVHGRARALAALVRQQRRRGTRWSWILRQFGPGLAPGRVTNRYLAWRGVKRAVPPPDWVTQREVNSIPRADLLAPVRRRWATLQTTSFGGSSETLAADELVADIHGLDVRRPFVDVDLWEFFLSLRAEVKFPDTRRKTLVRRCLRGKLPDALLDRTDKTVFGEHLLTHADYDLMRRYIVDPPYQIPGVDYRRLAERLEQRDFTLWEYCWARDLTSAHAFLANW
ncbi:MAG TPA: asparagine synthase-related protein [Gaiellales bacterium]